MTEKLKIWVVRIAHKHGDTVCCYSTEQLARDGVMRWARDNWKVERLEGDPDSLDDGRVVDAYFEEMEGVERYDIDCAILDEDVPAPLP